MLDTKVGTPEFVKLELTLRVCHRGLTTDFFRLAWWSIIEDKITLYWRKVPGESDLYRQTLLWDDFLLDENILVWQYELQQSVADEM
jgi:hypothetical protein